MLARAQGPGQDRDLEAPPIDYPDTGGEAVSGVVRLRAIVSWEGEVSELKLLSSSGVEELDQAAREGVAGRVYEPGRIQGRPVSVALPIEVHFSADGQGLAEARERADRARRAASQGTRKVGGF